MKNPKEKPKKIFDLPVATNLGIALTETMKSVSQHEGGIKQGEINLPNFIQEVIKTEEDAKIFIETMENIPEPNDKLKKAFRDFNKQETLEEVANQYAKNRYSPEQGFPEEDYYISFLSFRAGAKWQAERMYSEEEVDRILRNFRTDFLPIGQVNDLVFNEWFEQFKNK